jgi:hypothetical protein
MPAHGRVIRAVCSLVAAPATSIMEFSLLAMATMAKDTGKSRIHGVQAGAKADIYA